jgi:hypothetical protein
MRRMEDKCQFPLKEGFQNFLHRDKVYVPSQKGLMLNGKHLYLGGVAHSISLNTLALKPLLSLSRKPGMILVPVSKSDEDAFESRLCDSYSSVKPHKNKISGYWVVVRTTLSGKPKGFSNTPGTYK